MSSNSVNPVPCSLCGEGGHRPRCCPELNPDSGFGPDGFWKGQRMADDEEEETCHKVVYRVSNKTKPYVRLYVFSPRKVKHQPYNKLIRNKTK